MGPVNGCEVWYESAEALPLTTERGAEVFRACRACHGLTPHETLKAGPTLAGLFGRRIGLRLFARAARHGRRVDAGDGRRVVYERAIDLHAGHQDARATHHRSRRPDSAGGLAAQSHAAAMKRFPFLRSLKIAPGLRYLCPAGERLTYRYSNEEEVEGKTMRRYWTTQCPTSRLNQNARRGRSGAFRDGRLNMCLKPCSSLLDKDPDAMRTRRETVEHPSGTLKMRMGATHFLMKTRPEVRLKAWCAPDAPKITNSFSGGQRDLRSDGKG